MTRVAYLVRQLDDVPDGLSWLSPAERRVFDGLRFAKRRNDWLLGRWTAKQALSKCLQFGDEGHSSWEIRAAQDGAPEILHDGEPSELTISISHSARRAMCAVSSDGFAIGCDIEQISQRDRAFVETFLTTSEQQCVGAVPEPMRPALITMIWSAKESVLKTIRQGLRMDTRRIEVDARGSLSVCDWRPFTARQECDDRDFHGWWRCDEGFVFTLVADRIVDRPISLDCEADPDIAVRSAGRR